MRMPEKYLEALLIITGDNHDLASQLVKIILHSSDSMIGKTTDFFEKLSDETEDQIGYELLALIMDYKCGRRKKLTLCP